MLYKRFPFQGDNDEETIAQIVSGGDPLEGLDPLEGVPNPFEESGDLFKKSGEIVSEGDPLEGVEGEAAAGSGRATGSGRAAVEGEAAVVPLKRSKSPR